MTTEELQKSFDHNSKYHASPKWVIMQRDKGDKHWHPHAVIPDGWNNRHGFIPTFVSKKEAEEYLGDVLRRNSEIEIGTVEKKWWEHWKNQEYYVDEVLRIIRKMGDDDSQKSWTFDNP